MYKVVYKYIIWFKIGFNLSGIIFCKILKYFRWLIVFLIWIFVLVICFVFVIVILESCLLNVKGGMFNVVFFSVRFFFIKKLWFVIILLFFLILFKKLDFLIMCLLEILFVNKLDKK